MKRPTALVIRRDDRFSRLLREGGFEVLNLELIKSEPLADQEELRKKLASADEYDGLFLTSPVAAAVFVRELKGLGIRFGGKIFALGNRARTVLENAALEVIYQPFVNTAEEMIKAFGEREFSGRKFLFIRGDRSMRTIPELLGGKAYIDEVVVYETKEVTPDSQTSQAVVDQLRSREIDWVCFFSPSGVEAFRKTFPSEMISAVKAAVIGETTERAAAAAGFHLGFVSPRATAEDFAAGLIRHRRSIE